MEQLRAELSIVLGESISRLERVSEQPYAHMYSLYDQQGHAIPLMAKSFVCQGIAQQEAYKLSMLSREGDIRLPTVYGVVYTHQAPYKEILLIERLRGVSVEAPTRTPNRWNTLMEQIVDGVLAWHRIDSHGCVGTVDSTQENDWFCWYQQRVEVLWSTLGNLNSPLLTMDDRRLLYRTREALTHFFVGFDDPCVLVHGNLSLRSMLKDPKSDQLLAMLNPGMMLWAPREYELFRLCEAGMPSQLLFYYLQRAPVAESFLMRRWLYVVWEAVGRLIHTGKLERQPFDYASKQLLPWIIG
ncbi:Phosphotransferase enzyme family [Serratia quinivorans]|uniref:YcbJ family phosphotransferase n=1 Tax=Serratia quinivorans TaxID=137545 RepID=UPI00217A8585|nr:YcbJ family phosphotransferase [Serratia quinivorans]CAI0821065.1 Phosphotransferase enzyme family [Serratia quinivorans]CAI0916438.1 Phosphotransferase enzyme family [Serratia quinivorans]CAI1705584.1 Phosphotransferase enzyme family [Serratia quinivorans]CAI2087311.1 Phosphotransferase enzyme family [Serratia quinivorans]CAI2431867.1 Phosphotransferase enzyme family [Serratia quinivorans]